MASGTQQERRKRRGFQLDVEDMERRIVDFRLTLAREKRRCVEAQMLSQYQKLLRDKLNEDLDQSPENQLAVNTIQLLSLDDDTFRKLSDFLQHAIMMCQREEQQNKFQRVLRETLQESRRQSVMSRQSEGRPEPFCLFCASDMSSSFGGHQSGSFFNQRPGGGGNGHGGHHHNNTGNNNNNHGDGGPGPFPTQIPFVPIEFVPQQQTEMDEIDPRANQASFTPPPSAAPTPDVADTYAPPPPPQLQAHISSQRQHQQQTVGGSSQQVESTTSNASTQEQHQAPSQVPLSNNVGTSTVDVEASVDQAEDALVPEVTMRIEEENETQVSQEDETVGNSDDEEYNPRDEIRSILDSLRESGRLSQVRRQSQQRQAPSQPPPEAKKKKPAKSTRQEPPKPVPMEQEESQVESEERRSSTPLDDSMVGPMVIDEERPAPSPIRQRPQRGGGEQDEPRNQRSSVQREANRLRQAERGTRTSSRSMTTGGAASTTAAPAASTSGSQSRGVRIENISAKLRRHK